MKLEEGMYVRFDGMINKILEIDEDYIVFDMDWYDHWNDEVSRMKIDEFIKEYEPQVSNKLIKLLIVGDFLDEHCITKIYHNTCYTNDGWFINGDDIEDLVLSICTKEQFQRGSYFMSGD